MFKSCIITTVNTWPECRVTTLIENNLNTITKFSFVKDRDWLFVRLDIDIPSICWVFYLDVGRVTLCRIAGAFLIPFRLVSNDPFYHSFAWYSSLLVKNATYSFLIQFHSPYTIRPPIITLILVYRMKGHQCL